MFLLTRLEKHVSVTKWFVETSNGQIPEKRRRVANDADSHEHQAGP